MKFFVKIDRDTVKKNPNAGQTTTIIQTKETHLFRTRKKLPKEVVIGENVIINEAQHISGMGIGDKPYIEYRGEIIDKALINVFFENNIPIEVEFEHDTVIHSPIPPYSFEYENIELQCCGCKSKFNLDKLESECTYNGEDDCCEIEYENKSVLNK